MATVLKQNLIANYVGSGWRVIMELAFVPVYIKYLGMEAYGLIGIFTIVLSWLTLLDMGMTPTLSREMARFTGGAHSAKSIRDLLRSIEWIVFIIVILFVFALGLASDWLANEWLIVEESSTAVVAKVCTIIGFVAALRFVEGIYRSCIVGLQRQIVLNLVISTMATLRGLGAIAILIWVSSTIEAFFYWQGIISLLTVVLLIIVTYISIPKSIPAGQFSWKALSKVRNYAGGMIGITFLSILLTQVDKIFLSKLISLSEYGYYTLAATVAASIGVLASPISQAWFPRLNELNVKNDQLQLVQKFHEGAQLMSVTMGGAAVVIAVFSDVLLILWTNDPVLSRNTAILLRILVLGNMFNGLNWIPYQTQLCFGWTRLSIVVNTVSILCVVPALFIIAPRYGAIGTASIWLCVSAGNVLIGSGFMFRKILIGEQWQWYLKDVAVPLLVICVTTFLVRFLMPIELFSSRIGQMLILLVAAGFTLMMGFLFASHLRNYLFLHISKFLNGIK